MADQLLEYGEKVNANHLKRILDHIFLRNDAIAETGSRGTPICIWGTHGLGKTHIVTDFARERNWKFAYCAPAQFEEMGDLHGMPVTMDPDPNVVGDERTVYLPPDWVPTEEGPGILLLDDINRADDRILRGCMQLLQNFELFSWHLPKRWQIVATANPEGGDYSVTPMDDVMLTRMLHATLKFDPRIWAEWAAGAGVDPRGIAFVLTYPEAVSAAPAKFIPPKIKSADCVLGVIGAGNFARAVLLPELKKLSGVTLHTIATKRGASADYSQERFGFSHATTDEAAVLDNADINAVLIATRHDSHAALTAAALKAGKSVLVEKPLGLATEEITRVQEARASSDGFFCVSTGRCRRRKNHR